MTKLNSVSSQLAQETPKSTESDWVKRFKLFLALSRTPHGLLDMATPAFSVLVYLGGFPSLEIVIVGLITAFSGYTAVYALNDLVDYGADQLKSSEPSDSYLDSLMVRHPLAQNLLSYQEALIWTMGWACVALVGAYLLNPVCIVIFLGGAMLELIYCGLWQISPWRAVVSGVVKTSGAMAAIFAVDPTPSPLFLLILFSGLFFWEIGGQNIPADWVDIDVDRQFKAQTIPVRWGERTASKMVLVSLVIALVFFTMVFRMGFQGLPWIGALAILTAGIFLLLAPAIQLLQSRLPTQAMVLFNRASYFPVVLLFIALMLIWGQPALADAQPLCDMHHGFCEQTLDNRKVRLDVCPKPIKAMQSLLFHVTISGAPLPQKPYIDLDMPGMTMGPNQVKLNEPHPNEFEGKGVIVRCPSGKRIWRATVVMPKVGRCAFVFDVVY